MDLQLDERLNSCPPPQLPLELWAIVVDLLPHEDQRTCLFVSSSLHSLALSALFSHVIVYFGLWRSCFDSVAGEHEFELDHLPWLQDERAEMERVAHYTWEILRHISRAPDFARLVRKLSIRAYTPGPGIFELRCLSEALQNLHNLRSFRWYGESPVPSSEVLEVLSHSSGTNLVDLRIPSSAVKGLVSPPATRCTRLRTLALVREWYVHPRQLDDVSPVVEILADNANTLTRLSAHGEDLLKCPVRHLFNLQELELIRPEDLEGFELVIHHCSALLSLTVTLGAPGQFQFFTILESYPAALPELTSFKFICAQTAISPAHEQSLANFLKPKKLLRCLDVSFDGAGQGISNAPLLQTLQELPALEVLGVDFFCERFNHATFLSIDHSLPNRLSALLLHVEFWISSVSPADWVELIVKRSSLKYLHILDSADTLDLKQQILEDHPDSLELVGYGPYLRWIVNDKEDVPRYSPSWPLSKVMFRTVEDFGHTDWEWLLRHHDYLGIDTLYPGVRNL